MVGGSALGKLVRPGCKMGLRGAAINGIGLFELAAFNAVVDHAAGKLAGGAQRTKGQLRNEKITEAIKKVKADDLCAVSVHSKNGVLAVWTKFTVIGQSGNGVPVSVTPGDKIRF